MMVLVDTTVWIDFFGITIGKPVDCMIAAVAIEHDIPLLHNDRDFIPIEKHFGLKRMN
jgi:predicted nucleic acid-binding protein